MASFAKQKLSGSTNGRGILVVQTVTPGTLIHTATGTAGVLDELWLYGYNTDTVSRKLTIELGGTTAPTDDLEQTLAPESGLSLLVPGLILDGSVIVRAFAAAASLVVIVGYIHRITP